MSKHPRLPIIMSMLAPMLVFAVLSAAPTHAADTDAAPLPTRWMAPPGVERTLHEVWQPTGAFTLREFDTISSRAKVEAGRIAVIVENALYGDITAALVQYQSDLADYGYASVVSLVDGGTPADLRAYLIGLYGEPEGLVGTLLVGDVPYIIYELMQDWDGTGGDPPEYEDFPCDIFFMDMDGVWTDDGAGGTVDPGNGKYDGWSAADIEIWAGRLKVDTLSPMGAPADILNNYFAKNHLYRTGQLIPGGLPATGLVYVDDDWGNMVDGFGGDQWCVEQIYGAGNVTSVYDEGDPGDNATAGDYIGTQMSETYQFVQLRSHGYPGGHGFYENSRAQFEYVFNLDYRTNDPAGLFYSLFVCSGCDYTAEYGAYGSYLGGTVALNDDYGLLAWGSTKTGGMWNDNDFFNILGEPNAFGPAFVNWFNVTCAVYPSLAPSWWYGMVMIGDPALIPDNYISPLVSVCDVVPAWPAQLDFYPDGDHELGIVTREITIANLGVPTFGATLGSETGILSFDPPGYLLATGESEVITVSYEITGCGGADFYERIYTGTECDSIHAFIQDDFYVLEALQDTLRFDVSEVGQYQDLKIGIQNHGCGDAGCYLHVPGEPEFSGNTPFTPYHGLNELTITYSPQDAGNDTVTACVDIEISMSGGRVISSLEIVCIGLGPHQSVWHVAVDGDDVTGTGEPGNPFATIQHGLDTAAPGDTVLVADGAYTGDGNRDLDFGGKAVLLSSSAGDPSLCTIDCAGSVADPHRGFFFTNGEDSLSVVQGFTITNGYDDNGAGILCLANDGDMYPELPLGSGGAPKFIDCDIIGNTGDGVATMGYCAGPVLLDCHVDGNTGHGAIWSIWSAMAYVAGCTFNDNGGSGLDISSAHPGVGPGNTVLYCEMSGNTDDGITVGDPWGFSYHLTGCDIIGNGGWGIRDDGNAELGLTVDDSTIRENHLGGLYHSGWSAGSIHVAGTDVVDNEGIGIFSLSSLPASISTTLIAGNDSTGVHFTGNVLTISFVTVVDNGAGLVLGEDDGNPQPDELLIERTTIAGNGGVGLTFTGDGTADVVETIIAGNAAPACDLPGATVPDFACCDLDGNTGGNWSGPHADQFGVDGNFRLDPLFCDPAAGDYTLMSTSPCLDGNHDACGSIGAQEPGCSPPVLAIAEVKHYDPATGLPDSPYAGELVTVEGVVFVDSGTYSEGGMYLADATGGLNFYNNRAVLDVVVGDQVRITGPLIYDENHELYLGWPGMMPVAHVGEPAPTPYSIPNLLADYEHLGDFVSVFGEVTVTAADTFTLQQGGQTIDVIIDPDTGVDIAAVDVGEVWRVVGPCFNASGVMWLSPRSQEDLVLLDGSAPTDVDDTPLAYRLHGCVPNPFNPATTLGYDLPAASRVSLRIYDLTGRLVRSLVNTHQDAGRHAVRWDGRSDAGRLVAAGAYVCRLTAGSFTATQRMLLVK